MHSEMYATQSNYLHVKIAITPMKFKWKFPNEVFTIDIHVNILYQWKETKSKTHHLNSWQIFMKFMWMALFRWNSSQHIWPVYRSFICVWTWSICLFMHNSVSLIYKRLPWSFFQVVVHYLYLFLFVSFLWCVLKPINS